MNTRVLILIILLAAPHLVSGYTLDSSSATPNRIFKCQASTILANFSNFGTITGVYVLINSQQPVMWNGSSLNPSENFTMNNNGGGQWMYTYGNNQTIIYGIKVLTFVVSEGVVTSTNITNTTIIVYSDRCQGTNIQGYQNISIGLGNYTSKLWNSNFNLADFAIRPWIEYWGYAFYILVMFFVCITIYMKNQHIALPILVAFIWLGALATTVYVPPEFKNYIVLILGTALGAIFWKIFK